MLVEQQSGIEDWIQFLSKEQMPALAETVQKLNRLTSDEGARISQLTEQVLKDPSLTSRVLQVSNCVMYKGMGGAIKTITRAIVMLGFTTVRDVTLSMQILDNILKHKPSQHLMLQIASSFHAAMQARGMLKNVKAAEQEEIFISTLLLHFAELSMLSRDDEVSRRLNRLIEHEQLSPSDAAKEVIGCTFDELSLALAKQWNLGDVLIQALMRPKVPSRPVQAVLLGDELSQVAPLGWDAEPVVDVLRKIAKFRNIPLKEAVDDVRQMASMAHDMAVHYGAAKVRHLIPHDGKDEEIETPSGFMRAKQRQVARPEKDAPATEIPEAGAGPAVGPITPKPVSPEPASKSLGPTPAALQQPDEGIEDMIALALSGGKSAPAAKASAPKSETTGVEITGRQKTQPPSFSGVGNAELQINIMQELSRLIADKRMDVNKMLELVMEGMHTAIGLDRVVMCLVSRDRKKMVPKFFKGEMAPEFKTGFQITLDEENAFSACIIQSQQLWIGSKLMAGRAYLHTAQLQKALGWKEYLVAPIIVARKPIGVFYGDCAISGKPLNDQQYAGFNMLAQQAGLALTAANG